MFWAVLIVRFFGKLKWKGIVGIGLLAVFSYVSYSFFVLPLSIQPGGCAAVFVYLGWKLKSIDLKKYITNMWLMLVAVGTLILEIMFDVRVDMARNIYKMGMVSVLGLYSFVFLYCMYLILFILK